MHEEAESAEQLFCLASWLSRRAVLLCSGLEPAITGIYQLLLIFRDWPQITMLHHAIHLE